MQFTIYTDGASSGNPGPAGGAYLFVAENKIIHEHALRYKNMTNNQAEYTTMLKALEDASTRGMKDVICVSDSQLMVRQLNGKYAVKSDNLKPLFDKIKSLLVKFDNISFEHVKRENDFIKRVDWLAKH